MSEKTENRGRKIKGEQKRDHVINLRVTEKEFHALAALAGHMKKSKWDILKSALMDKYPLLEI